MVRRAKIVIVGAGAVGSTFAYTLMRGSLFGEIVLIDANRERAEGEVMDLEHGLFFSPHVELKAGDYPDCADAAIVAITAGAKQKAGESRLDLVQRNVEICKQILSEILKYTRDTLLLMVTNPVDILTYVAYRISGFPASRVIGSGTVLDSARFRYILSGHCSVDPRNVHAYVIGEHGDSEVAAWSLTHIGGIPIQQFCSVCKVNCSARERNRIAEAVRNSAYHVIEYKGATNFAVSLALENIVGAVIRDSRSVLTVSIPLEGQFGLTGVALSVPAIIDRNGVSRVLEAPLPEAELNGLRHSAEVLKDVISRINLS